MVSFEDDKAIDASQRCLIDGLSYMLNFLGNIGLMHALSSFVINHRSFFFCFISVCVSLTIITMFNYQLLTVFC